LSNIKDNNITRIFCTIADTTEKDLSYDGRVTKINDDLGTEKLYMNSIKLSKLGIKVKFML